MKKKWLVVGGVLAAMGGVLMIKIGGAVSAPGGGKNKGLDLSLYPDTAPGRPVRLLFIHHSVGGRLLADAGPVKERADNIFDTHPDGGGLRALLVKNGYEVHEASYGSQIGEDTDLFHWLPKFTKHMEKVLTVDENDRFLDGKRHDVVVFKSCYPNNRFVGGDDGPGNPNGPELTVANAKATLKALLPELQKHPDVLFVYMTTPPVAPKGYGEPMWKYLAKKVLGKPLAVERVAEQAAWARELAAWAASPEGWLKDYPLENVVVFDLYDVLTDEGASNVSRYPGEDGTDSHPNRAGNEKVAAAFVPFLNRALNRMP